MIQRTLSRVFKRRGRRRYAAEKDGFKFGENGCSRPRKIIHPLINFGAKVGMQSSSVQVIADALRENPVLLQLKVGSLYSWGEWDNEITDTLLGSIRSSLAANQQTHKIHWQGDRFFHQKNRLAAALLPRLFKDILLSNEALKQIRLYVCGEQPLSWVGDDCEDAADDRRRLGVVET